MSSDWPTKKISDITFFRNNKRIPLKSLDREKRKGIYPYYGASGVVDHIDGYLFDGTYLLISEDGENLRSRKTPIAFKARGKFWVNNHAHILEEKEEGILDYLEYYFSILDLTPFITGAVQPKLNKANLDSIEIPVPPVGERKVINNVLNSLSNKIDINQQINQTLEQMAQAIFKSWFVDFEPVKAKIAALEAGGSEEDALLAAMQAISGKDAAQLAQLQAEHPDQYTELRTTAELFPSAMQDSEIGEIPFGWASGVLADISRFNSDRISTEELGNGDYISTENMLENKKGVREASSIPSAGSVPKFTPKQVLVSNIRPYFKKIWFANRIGGRSPDVLGFEVITSGTEEFLYSILFQDCFFEYMMLTSKGAKMPRGDKNAIMQFPVIIPYSNLIKAFCESIKPLYILITENNKECVSLESLREILLPQLLSGAISAESAHLSGIYSSNSGNEHAIKTLISEIETHLPPKSHFVMHDSSRKQRENIEISFYSTKITGALAEGGAEYFKLPAFLMALRNNKALEKLFEATVDGVSGVPFLMDGATAILNKFLGKKIKFGQRTALVLLAFPKELTRTIPELLDNSRRLSVNAGLPPIDEVQLFDDLQHLREYGLVVPLGRNLEKWRLIEKFHHEIDNWS